jgi:hypothetical protein
MLSHRGVLSWWEYRSLRSRLSADQYLRQLGLLLERTGQTPASVITLARKNPDRLRDLLIRDAASLKKAGRLDSYISKFFEGLKSYFRFHRVTFDGFPALSAIKGASLSNERVPSQEELGRVLDHLSLRGRVLALFMAHSGLRPGVLGSYQGELGLRVADLPDLRIEGGRPSFEEIPFVIRVPANLSKTRVAYVTFGTTQLASAFLAYLEERTQRGETLGPDSPVVASNSMRGAALRSRQNARYSKGFLTTKVVVQEVGFALHSSVPSGVRWRPYVLRAYCSTRLLMAEGAGKITHDLREAILGHDGGIASRYNVGKRWGEDLLKEARREYANAAEFLETSAQNRTDVAAAFRKEVLGLSGYTGDAAAAHMDDSNEQILELLRVKLMEGQLPPPTTVTESDTRVQRPVTLEEADRLFAEGWTFVSNFGTDRVILQAPSGAGKVAPGARS